MRVGRWFGLAMVPAVSMTLYIPAVVIGDGLKGRLDSVMYAASFLLLTAAIVAAGLFFGHRLPVAYAAWTLPFGAAAAMTVWLLLPGQAAPMGYVVAGLAAWVAGLTALSVLSAATARWTGWVGVSLASVGGLALVLFVPFAVVRWTLGATAAPWSTAAMWAPVGLVDYDFGSAISRFDALLIASRPAAIVMVGTAFVLGYVVGQARPTRPTT
jgi:hypothetical protein